MKPFRKIFAAILLAFALSASAFAGDIQMPGVSAAPGDIDMPTVSAAPGDIEMPLTTQALAIVIHMILG